MVDYSLMAGRTDPFNTYETEEEKRRRLALEAQQTGQQPVSPDTFNRMVQVESGGRDYTTEGQPLTSPKGAMFSAQVMPTTAQQPGFGVRPAQSQTAEEYNRVGRDYFEAMRKRYNDDEKAMAAYNAGPGRVDQALRQAQQTGQDYKSFLPKETQSYIQKVGQRPSMAQQAAQAQQQPQQVSQPAPTIGFINQYQSIQDDPRQLLSFGFNEQTPEWLRNRAKTRAGELLRQQDEQQKAQAMIPTMSETDLAKALREKTTGGSYLKAALFGLLGMEQSAMAEAAKLGIGKEQSMMLSDGTPAIIKVAQNGTPIEGYNATTGAKLSTEQLVSAQAGVASKLNIVGGTYINDQTGEVGRVITDEKTGQSYIQTDKGRKPMTGFRPQSSTGSLTDQRARMVQEINLRLQGKTAEEQMAILRPYNQQLVAAGYPAISPQEVGIAAPQIQAPAQQAQPMPTAPVSPQQQAAPARPVNAPVTPGQLPPPQAGARPTGPQLAAQAEQLKTEGEIMGKDIGEKRVNLGKSESNADYLITKINELVTHPGFEVSVGATVQPGFQLIPGTDKSDWYARFQEIKGQAFLQAVQELRGMGALSNQEGDSATKAIQRMSTSQSEKEFKAAAQDFQGIIQRGIDRNRVKLGMQPLYGTPPASQQSQQRPQPQTGAGKVRKYNPQTGQLE